MARIFYLKPEEYLESLIGKDYVNYVSKDNDFKIKYVELLLFMQHVELKLFTTFS